MKILTEPSFKTMPWKNGRGYTTELFREDIEGKMAFRLSKAVINENGMFSIFEGLNRYLTILSGQGCALNIDTITHTLYLNDIFHFHGDSQVEATLINGEVTDFNVFYNPKIYACEVSWVNQKIISSPHSVYLYSARENKLMILDENEEFTISENLIMIEIKKAP